VQDETVPVIATWFHADTNEYKGSYSQTLGDSASEKHFQIYLRSIFVFFASIIRQKEKVKLKLFLNDQAFKIITESFKAQLHEWKIDLIVLQNTHKFYDQINALWANQFFILDILQYQSSINEDFCLMDSDVVCINKQLPKLKLIDEMILYKLSNNPHEVINGISIDSLYSLGNSFGYQISGREFAYYGGELIYVSKSVIRSFYEALEDVYQKNKIHFESKLEFAREEAHLISIVSVRYRIIDAGERQIIRRVWTQPWTHRLVPQDWKSLTYLHLPSEKKTGIYVLYRAAINKNSWFWTSENSEWDRRISKLFGLQSYGIRKLVRDVYLLRNGFFRHLRTTYSRLKHQ
jgi:hypothetical protein